MNAVSRMNRVSRVSRMNGVSRVRVGVDGVSGKGMSCQGVSKMKGMNGVKGVSRKGVSR